MLRAVISLLLCFTLPRAPLGAQSPSNSDKLYRQLEKLPPNAEVDIRLRDGTRIRGNIVTFDRTAVTVSGHPNPIPLAEIRSLKTRQEPPVWSPLWGFARTWKVAAITAGAVLLVGVLVAKNTR